MKYGNYCILCIVQKKLAETIYNNFINAILKMETIFMNTENSKTNEPHRFRLTLSDKD